VRTVWLNFGCVAFWAVWYFVWGRPPLALMGATAALVLTYSFVHDWHNDTTAYREALKDVEHGDRVLSNEAPMRLNGWQRLWVLLTVLWSLLMALIAPDSNDPLSTKLALWLIPPLAFYAFGWAVAWVRRGFAS